MYELPNKGPYRLVWTIAGKTEQFRYATEGLARRKAAEMKRMGGSTLPIVVKLYGPAQK